MQHEPKGKLLGQRDDGKFFVPLKKDRIHLEEYATRVVARASVFDYIERFYNRMRRHSALGYLSPEQFEQAA